MRLERISSAHLFNIKDEAFSALWLQLEIQVALSHPFSLLFGWKKGVAAKGLQLRNERVELGFRNVSLGIWAICICRDRHAWL